MKEGHAASAAESPLEIRNANARNSGSSALSMTETLIRGRDHAVLGGREARGQRPDNIDHQVEDVVRRAAEGEVRHPRRDDLPD